MVIIHAVNVRNVFKIIGLLTANGQLLKNRQIIAVRDFFKPPLDK